MPTLKITRSALDKLPPAAAKEKPDYYFDTILKGFAVRVSSRGVKAFLVQGRVNGKLHRKALGRYPNVIPEQARLRARDILSAMAAGAAPENKPKVLVADALDEWLEVHVDTKLKPRTAADYRSIADTVLKKRLGTKAVVEVERADLAALHHARRETPRRTNYELAVVRSLFSYCEAAGYRPDDSNPATKIKPYPENRRERFLSEDEVGRVAAAIAEAESAGTISIYAAAGLRLALLTGMRSGELKALTWREVDLQRRLLLLEDSKTGRKAVYLSEAAAEILTNLPRIEGNAYVLAGRKVGEPLYGLNRAWEVVRAGAGLEDVRLRPSAHICELRCSRVSLAAADRPAAGPSSSRDHGSLRAPRCRSSHGGQRTCIEPHSKPDARPSR